MTLEIGKEFQEKTVLLELNINSKNTKDRFL